MSKFVVLAVAALFAFSSASATVLSSLNGNYTGTVSSAATYTLPDAVKGGLTVDFSFRFTPTTKAGAKDELDDNDFLGLWLNGSTGPSIGVKANCGTGNCTDDVFVRLGGSDGIFLPRSDLAANTEYRVFGYLYKSEGSAVYDNFEAWLNPTAAEMRDLTGADAHAKSNVGLAGKGILQGISSIGFRTANLDNNVVMTVSNVNANAVPEPSTLALFGLALAGLGFARRRKYA